MDWLFPTKQFSYWIRGTHWSWTREITTARPEVVMTLIPTQCDFRVDIYNLSASLRLTIGWLPNLSANWPPKIYKSWLRKKSFIFFSSSRAILNKHLNASITDSLMCSVGIYNATRGAYSVRKHFFLAIVTQVN